MENKPVPKKPNLCIDFKEYGHYEIDYSGSIALLTKEEFNKIRNNFKKLKTRYLELEEQLKNYKDENIRLKQENESVNNENIKLKFQYKKIEENYSKFISRQGKGRPKVLTDRVKSLIKNMYSTKVSISQIHQALVKKGISISYETVRDYITRSNNKGEWL